jgi:hypothetical protein
VRINRDRLKQLKQEMAQAHPDKGGTATTEQFMAAQKKYHQAQREYALSGGSGSLNRISASISGAPAGIAARVSLQADPRCARYAATQRDSES